LTAVFFFILRASFRRWFFVRIRSIRRVVSASTPPETTTTDSTTRIVCLKLMLKDGVDAVLVGQGCRSTWIDTEQAFEQDVGGIAI